MLSVVGVQWFALYLLVPLWSVACRLFKFAFGFGLRPAAPRFRVLLRCVWEDVSVRKCNVARWRPVTRDGP